MTNPLRRLLALFRLAFRRVWANRWLSAAELAGAVAVIGLALTIPMYADAVYHRIMSENLGTTGPAGTRLPPFAFMFRYVFYLQAPTRLADLLPADRFISHELPARLQLPNTGLVRYFQTNNFRLFPMRADGTHNADDEPLLRIPLTAISHFADHVTLLEGEQPPDTPPTGELVASEPPATNLPGGGFKTDMIQVLVSQALAERAGLQIGDRYIVISGHADAGAVHVPVVIAGVWMPRDPTDTYWFYRPDLLSNMLIVPEGAFTQKIAPTFERELAEVLWYANFDGRSVRVWNAPALIDRISGVITRAGQDDLNLQTSASPLNRLQGYRADSLLLTGQLYTFSLPLFLLAFAFVLLTAGLRANSLRNEAAVLRSRGASAWQVLGVATIQSALIAAAGLVLATPMAMLVAQLMGKTRSFLDFSGAEWLPVALTPSSLPFGLAAAGALVAISTLPVSEAARHTILSYKLERARSLLRPWWQRAGIDVLLLIPAAYWTWLLQRQGYLDISGATTSAPASALDPFGNPSLFIVSSLSMISLTLLFIRLLPTMLRALAGILSRLPGAAMLLALRQLARTPGAYATPVLLLSLTLALAIFTSSMAATLDRHLDQQMRYTVGGDARILGVGHDNRQMQIGFTEVETLGRSSANTDSAQEGASAGDPTRQSAGPRWLFLPVTDYLKAPGVTDATRVGQYPIAPEFGAGGNKPGQFIGIDWRDYARIAFWRKDFAAEPLGGLLNALASAPDGVLVPESIMRQNALQVGDTIRAAISLPDATVRLTFKVVGAFTLWPTWFPNDEKKGPAFIGNLDYVFEAAGGQAPYDVWLKLAGDATRETVLPELRRLDNSSWNYQEARALIEREQARPQRQGLFGMLSTGFIAAAALTVLGLFIYAAFSFRRRMIELGVLRAIGLSAAQMSSSLAWEMGVLFGAGVGTGSALGLWASQIYLPYLQEPAGSLTRAASFVVTTNPAQINLVYALMALLFAVTVAGLVALLRRLRIFQAVKLGETE